MEFDVGPQPDVKASELRFRGMARRARNMYPLANTLRDIWHGSERRLFITRGASTGEPWPERQPSTLLRYRYPIRHSKGGTPTYALGATAGTGHYTRLLRHSLTQPHQPGVRDDFTLTPGGIETNYGIKPNGPIAHGLLFEKGGGDRAARTVVFWDDLAQRQGAEATQDHIAEGTE